MTMAQLSYIVTIIAIALTCILAQEYYSDQYDDIDAVGILENDKLRDQYYKCFMDLGPCQTADAKFFKGIPIHRVPQRINFYDRLFDQLGIEYSSTVKSS